MTIKRSSDSRVVKNILHRIADIPGGVGVKASLLGGLSLQEGTPLAAGTNGLFEVIKTAKVAEAYTANATSLKIKKGSHFVVGDKIADENYTDFAVIAAIDKSNAAYDLLTISANAFSINLPLGAVIIECNATVDDAVTHDGVVQGAISATDATSFNVDKGHTFVVGDIIAGTGADPMTGKEITNIDRGNDAYDTITIGAANGKALADNEDLICVTAANGVTEKKFTVQTVTKKAAAVAIAGSFIDVVSTENLNVDAWVSAVLKKDYQVPLTPSLLTDLKGVIVSPL